jgi:CDP-diacylglycerol--glycerol-3-phosphate 3-phosphatidyltransferase
LSAGARTGPRGSGADAGRGDAVESRESGAHLHGDAAYTMPVNLPILLTWLRIVLIPVFVGIFYLPDAWMSPFAKNWTSASVFLIAAITDWLDGWLARRMGATTAFGAFLDPVADKLMVAAALIVLVWIDRAETFLAIIIIGREIAISALREWMAQIGASKSVAVHMLGKLKTTAQMVAIPFLLFDDDLFGVVDTRLWGTGLIWISAILTVWSMVYYLQKALPEIRKRVK